MYISLGRDKRPRGDIERAAKIGLSNGALYRRCEGTNCDKVEGKNMVKPLFCSRCKMVGRVTSFTIHHGIERLSVVTVGLLFRSMPEVCMEIP